METKLLYALLFFLPLATLETLDRRTSASVYRRERKDPSVCQLQPNAGPCRALDRQWYYNITLRDCALFQGGCLGNGNRFKTRRACNRLCVNGGKKNPCKQPVDPGPCMAAINRWYYDPETDDCQWFVYGGCKGNENNFETREECEQKCVKVRKPWAHMIQEPVEDTSFYKVPPRSSSSAHRYMLPVEDNLLRTGAPKLGYRRGRV